MVTLAIVQVGDPVLRAKARELTVEEIRSAPIQWLIELMRTTMHDAPGVGLAAPQIGESLQLAVLEDRQEYQEGVDDDVLAARERAVVPFTVIVNPKLTIVEAEPVEFTEGCLSFEGFVMSVARAKAVRVDALDHRGEPITIHATGWHARILQHEIDHLHGTLCVDRMTPRTLATSANHGRFGT